MNELEWEEYAPRQWAAKILDKDLDILEFDDIGEFHLVVNGKLKYATRSKKLAFEFAQGYADGYVAAKKAQKNQ